jgi:membrane-associated protease RseP (regulator of RpoE activity)
MSLASETTAIVTLIGVALALLVWGFNRARPYGQIGILAWLQSVILIVPWLLFFGLIAAGIYINFIGVLLLLVGSTAVYIWLGRRLRQAGQAELLRERAAKMLQSKEEVIPQVTAVVAEPPAIPDEDLQLIRGIFSIDTFFATQTIPYDQGVVFQGNLRGEVEPTYEKLREKLMAVMGDRYRLFLVANQEGKPVVIILPSSNDPRPLTWGLKALSLGLCLLALATTGETVGLFFGFDLFNNLNRWRDVLPLTALIWVVFVAHEIGHQVAARHHQVKFSWPFFIASWQIASFGAINRFQSLLRDRRVLFDVALAGPAAGGVVSLVMLVTGLHLSEAGSTFKLPTEFFQGSILVGTLARVVMGKAVQEPVVDVHPLVIIGWLGLVVTALNLMPAGQLDGGRIVQAVYGRKTAQRTTIATLVILAIVSFLNPANPVLLYWGAVILFLQRGLERPCLNDLSEPDDARAALGLLALFLMAATLVPLTPSLAGRLGIGG